MTRGMFAIFFIIVALFPIIRNYALHRDIKDPKAEVSFFIEKTTDANLLQDFVREYPNSMSVKTAQDRLSVLAEKSAFPVPHLTKTFQVTPETIH